MYLDRRWLIYHAKSCFKIKVTSKEVLQYLFWYHFKICEPTTLPKNQDWSSLTITKGLAGQLLWNHPSSVASGSALI